MGFNGSESDAGRSILLLPAVTEDFHQVFSLILTMLSRVHLPPIQPFPEFQPDWSRRAFGDEVGRIIGVMNPRQSLPGEVWETGFQIVQS